MSDPPTSVSSTHSHAPSHLIPSHSSTSRDDDPLQVDIVLALLDRSAHHDHLQLANDKQIKAVLARYADEMNEEEKEKGEERILFSDVVIKFNRRHKAQKRHMMACGVIRIILMLISVLMITTIAIYNMEESRYKTVKRRIPIKMLAAVTLSDQGDDFAVHVRNDYDYHYRTPRRSDILHCIAQRYKQLTGEDLTAQVSTLHALSSFILTKPKLQQQTSSLIHDSATTSTISNKIRALVSKKKIRWQKDGFDLDLTYITGRLIAMGFPSEDLEGLYRNPYSEVYRFFETRHRDHYKVYNLCSERKYDVVKFHNRVACFPFDDHNAPSLRMMYDLCVDVTNYLAQDPQNVVTIHCKAGKGRTGVMISAYMLWSGMFTTAEDALNYFGEKRTQNSKGVTIPSQARLVHYFERYLREYYGPERPFNWSGQQLVLTNVRFTSVPHFNNEKGCSPYFKILNIAGEKVYDSRKISAVRPAAKTDKFIAIPCAARVHGEIKFVFSDQQIRLHTSFIDGSYICLPKNQIDKALKDKRHKKFDSNFQMELYFRHDDIYVDKQAQLKQEQNKMKLDTDTPLDADTLRGTQKAAGFLKRLHELEETNHTQAVELENASHLVAQLRSELARLRTENLNMLQATTVGLLETGEKPVEVEDEEDEEEFEDEEEEEDEEDEEEDEIPPTTTST